MKTYTAEGACDDAGGEKQGQTPLELESFVVPEKVKRRLNALA